MLTPQSHRSRLVSHMSKSVRTTAKEITHCYEFKFRVLKVNVSVGTTARVRKVW